MLITMKSIEKIPGSFLILEDGLVDNGCFFVCGLLFVSCLFGKGIPISWIDS